MFICCSVYFYVPKKTKIGKTTMTLCWLLKAQEIKDTCCSERTCRNAKLWKEMGKYFLVPYKICLNTKFFLLGKKTKQKIILRLKFLVKFLINIRCLFLHTSHSYKSIFVTKVWHAQQKKFWKISYMKTIIRHVLVDLQRKLGFKRTKIK